MLPRLVEEGSVRSRTGCPAPHRSMATVARPACCCSESDSFLNVLNTDGILELEDPVDARSCQIAEQQIGGEVGIAE